MANEIINTGTTPNDGTGDKLRNAFIKVNSNFLEVYTDKVDKVSGKSLIADSEISRLASVTNQDVSGISVNTNDIDIIEGEQIKQNNAISLNTAKVGITSGQASAITANTLKVGITTTQANDILSNNEKVSLTTEQAGIIADTSGVNTGDQDISIKVDKVVGKGLSQENFTTTEKSKLSAIQDGAEVNVNADWNSTSGDSEILNKPTIPSPITIDATPTDGSSNAVSSNGVFDAFTTKVDKVVGSSLIEDTAISRLEDTSGLNTGDQDLSGKVDKVTDKSLILDTEISRLENVTNQTKISLGLENVDNKSSATIRGEIVQSNIPSLDASIITSGIIDPNRLPSFVDDVLEFANLASFPASGETGKIYIVIDTNKTYRWSGTVYVYITSGAVDSVSGKTGIVTLVKADVGLGNVENTSDADKIVSTATQDALNLKVDIVAGERLVNAAEIVKLANTSGLNTGDQDLSGKVDKVADKSLILDSEISRLASVTNQDISVKVDKVTDKSLILDSEISRLASVTNQTKSSLVLDNVDNTSDADKPVSTAAQTAFNLKVDKDYNYPVNVISTATNATVKEAYVFTTDATLTLPIAPTAGDWVEVSNLSATPSPIIARNGKKIVGLEENLTIDTAYAGFRLVFTGDAYGWTIIGQ